MENKEILVYGESWSGVEFELIKINHMQGLSTGVANGYVKISKHHKYVGKDLQMSDYDLINVHGGVTYSEIRDDKFVIGFDTCHYNDNKKDQNLDYCIQETLSMLDQVDKLELYNWYYVPVVLFKRIMSMFTKKRTIKNNLLKIGVNNNEN